MSAPNEKVLKTKQGSLTLAETGLRLEHGSQKQPQYISMPLGSVDSCKIIYGPRPVVIVPGFFLLVASIIWACMVIDGGHGVSWWPMWPIAVPLFLGAVITIVSTKTLRPVLIIRSYGQEQIVATVKGSDVEVMIDFIEAVDAAKLACKKAPHPGNPPLA